jgi:hypothetical protein
MMGPAMRDANVRPGLHARTQDSIHHLCFTLVTVPHISANACLRINNRARLAWDSTLDSLDEDELADTPLVDRANCLGPSLHLPLGTVSNTSSTAAASKSLNDGTDGTGRT